MTADGPIGHRSAAPRRVTMARWVLVAILAAVLVIVLWPSRPAGAEQSSLEQWFADLHARGLPGWIGFGLVEFSANVLMFAPLGVLGVLARPPFGAVAVVACGAALSAAVELGQWLLIPGRTGDYRDVIANIIGAVLGVLLAERFRPDRPIRDADRRAGRPSPIAPDRPRRRTPAASRRRR
jgi:hypothetical protein